jgi:hypothetical protein
LVSSVASWPILRCVGMAAQTTLNEIWAASFLEQTI